MKALKNKESSIYDPESRFFEGNDDEDDGEGDEAKKRVKPKKFKDVLRDQILEDMESAEVGASRNDDNDKATSKFAYDEQQEELRKAFLKESKAADENEDDWMVVKKKRGSQDDPRKAEILQEFKKLEQLSTKKNSNPFSDPRGEVKDGEQFLINFMKNKKWIDKDDMAMNIAEDEESVDADRADDFEAKYNFRFEQAAAETASSGAASSIQTYARGQTMNTIRRPDDVRKEKRNARKDRKEAERRAKEEQLKRLKNAKREEMQRKLFQVKAVLGSVEEAEIDEAAIMKVLEGDYDPEKFEKAMQEAYGDEFYQKEDAVWKSDMDVRKTLEADEEGADVVGQDDAEGGLYDEEDYGNEEDEGNADEWQDDDDEEYVGGDDPNESQLEKKIKTKLQDELYKLDYEDIVAGMPTRFKYRQVEPNDYGLTTQEILLARDSTLKQFVSLKKMAPYNEDGEFMTGSKKRRRFREMLKQDLEEELGVEVPQDDKAENRTDTVEEEGQPKKKRRRLKKGKSKGKEESDKNTQQQENPESCKETVRTDPPADNEKSKKRQRQKKAKRGEKEDLDIVNRDFSESIQESSIGKDAANVEPSKKNRIKKNKKKSLADLPKSRLASYGL
jgi:protein KRI1